MSILCVFIDGYVLQYTSKCEQMSTNVQCVWTIKPEISHCIQLLFHYSDLFSFLIRWAEFFPRGEECYKIKGVPSWEPSRGQYGSLANQWGRFTKPDCFIDLIPDLIWPGRCYKIDLSHGQLFARVLFSCYQGGSYLTSIHIMALQRHNRTIYKGLKRSSKLFTHCPFQSIEEWVCLT